MCKSEDKQIRITCRGADTLPLDAIEDFQGGLKKRSKKQVEQIIKSILEYGFTFPFFIWNGTGHNYCLDGHGRIQALSEMRRQGYSLPLFPVAYIDADDEDEAKNKLLRMNSQYGEMTVDSVMEFVGDMEIEWEDLCLPELPDGAQGKEGDVDAEPRLDDGDELQSEWGVEIGQLWQLGEHRLLCGDSLDDDVVRAALGEERADIAVIDPPFELAFLPHVMDPCIVFGQAKHVRMIPEELWRFERIINKGVMHRSATVKVGHMHAFVAQCGTDRVCPDDGKTYPSIVECLERESHPHEKASWLIAEHLTKWSPPWSVCFDPFSGSGTTIIACEQLGRKCRAIEISPKYVAITLQRYLDATGTSPVMLDNQGDAHGK